VVCIDEKSVVLLLHENRGIPLRCELRPAATSSSDSRPTPKYGRWLNQVEVAISLFSYQ
jgi:hypothetical protein